MDLIDLVARAATKDELVLLLRETEEQRQKLDSAISWALGEGDSDFGNNKPENAKPFWWRTELRRRAGRVDDLSRCDWITTKLSFKKGAQRNEL